jgi:hypothetical protein
VTQGINGVRQRLDQEVADRRPERGAYLSHFTPETPVYALVETLGPATDLSKLKKLATQDGGDRLKNLATQVTALHGETVAAKLTVARSRRDLNESLVAAARAAIEFDAVAYAEAQENERNAGEEHAKLRHEALEDLGLVPEGEEAWQKFVLSGEEYRRHAEGHDYPQERDSCLYCRQPLEDDALALIRRYQDFANDASRQRAKDNRDLASTLGRGVTELNLAPLTESLAQARESEDDQTALDGAGRLVAALSAAQTALADCEPVDWDPVRKQARAVEAESLARKEAAEKLMTSLTAKEGERAEELRKATADHDALKDELELHRRLPALTEHVERAQWVERAEKLLPRFSGVLRSLTETAKTASGQLLNTDFETRFQAECEALRAPKVELDFPGREGKAARRKMVSAQHRPSEVLSEGEQKVIALADFLAEASLRLTPAPLVFDDPVSSLDYRRIHEVADRVTALAADRQVVVFTHNIWFAAELLAEVQERGETKRCTYYSVSDEQGGKGAVTRGSHPRWDTISKTKGKINDAIQSAKSSDGEAREALIERAYSLIRSWCEVAVELELLAGVTQRFEPNVSMTKLDKIKGDHLSDAVEVILPIFKKACRTMEGHSQPLETLAVRPSLDELEQEWHELQEALKVYRGA